MAFQAAAFEAADAANSDLEDAELAVLVGLSASGERQRGDTSREDGAIAQERSSGDGGKRRSGRGRKRLFHRLSWMAGIMHGMRMGSRKRVGLPQRTGFPVVSLL